VAEFERRLRRILGLETGFLVLFAAGFGAVGGLESAGAFLAGGLLSLVSLIVLGAAARAVGGGRFHWLLGVLFVSRLLLYAAAFSAILKVYPERDTELACGVLQSVLAILVEALIANQQDART
jgi:hypothetical protein